LHASTGTRLQATLRRAAIAAVLGLVICLAVVMYWDDWGASESPRAHHGTQPGQPYSREGRETTERQTGLPVPDLFSMADGELMADDELTEAGIRVPVEKWHTQPVENIGGETVQQLVQNLANYDDMHLATTTTGSRLYHGTHKSVVHKVAHLFRVRRLLAIEQEFAGTVTPVMVAAYAEALETWPAVYRDWTRRFHEGGPLTNRYEPTDVDKLTMRAAVATYFMGESGDPALLGVLLDGYQTQQRWLDEYKRAARAQCPVPPAFTLYAIHRLVSTVPEGSLSLEARSARKSYLFWAEDHIPSPAKEEVSAWNAQYDEAQLFRRIADPENVLLREQPKMVMKEYPLRFKDGAPFELYEMPNLSQQGEAWCDRLFAAARAIVEK